MPKASATLVNEVETELQDDSNVLWSAAELIIQMEDALREVSEYSPHVTMDTMEFESRTGMASATTSGSLVDTVESQFVSTDVNKVIYNPDDRTWAIVTAFTSTSILVLSADIMASGENYEMFNQDCWAANQLYVGGVEDYIGDDNGVKQVEYPIGWNPPIYRAFEVENNVLTVDYRSGIPDSGTADANIEVNVWFNRKHQVNQLTDLAGEVDLPAGGYAAGLSTIHIDGMGASDVLVEDSEFTIAGLRGLYRLTAAATMSSNEGDIDFYPPLQNAILDDDAITFVSSTLSRSLERQVVEFTAGRAVISKGALLLREANSAITSVASSATALGLIAAKVARGVLDVADARTAADLMDEAVLLINSSVDSMATEIALANTALDSGNTFTNTVTVGGPNVPGQYAAEAQQRINTAQGYARAATGYREEVTAGAENVRAQNALSAAEIASAAASANEALGFIQKAATELATVDRTREYTRWGERKMARVIDQLISLVPPNQAIMYSAR